MRSMTGLLVVAVAVAACSKKPLQEIPPSGSGGSISIGTGQGGSSAAVDAAFGNDAFPGTDAVVGNDAGAGDATLDVTGLVPPPFTGRRSFTVTARLQPDNGIPPLPASHTFTVTLDADLWTATMGGAGEG